MYGHVIINNYRKPYNLAESQSREGYTKIVSISKEV